MRQQRVTQIRDQKTVVPQQVNGILQRRATRQVESGIAPPIVHEVLRSSGRPLDDETRAFMEPRFGHDFSQVRVHTDDKAAESARAVNARAYTVGQHVVMRQEEYAPTTDAGKRLLAHELVHVIQQGGNSRLQKLQVGAAGDVYEREADRMADKVVRISQPTDERWVSLRSTPYPTLAMMVAVENIKGRLFSVQRQKTSSACSRTSIENCTDEDLLTAICIGEAGNLEDRDGKKGVINVVMNRVLDGSFGKNVKSVVTQSGQFLGLEIGIKRLNNPLFSECRNLAKEVIASPYSDITGGALFFNQSCEKDCDQYCTGYIGDGKSRAHYFARRATESEKKDCKIKEKHCCRNPRQKPIILSSGLRIDKDIWLMMLSLCNQGKLDPFKCVEMNSMLGGDSDDKKERSLSRKIW